MKKSTMLLLLLLSAIAQFADALTGAFMLDFLSLGSVVLSIIFMINAKKVFGDEVKGANTSCLVTVIVAGGVSILIGNTIGLLISIVSAGIGFIVLEPLDSLLNIGLGIWQILMWSKLRKVVEATAKENVISA